MSEDEEYVLPADTQRILREFLAERDAQEAEERQIITADDNFFEEDWVGYFLLLYSLDECRWINNNFNCNF